MTLVRAPSGMIDLSSGVGMWLLHMARGSPQVLQRYSSCRIVGHCLPVWFPWLCSFHRWLHLSTLALLWPPLCEGMSGEVLGEWLWHLGTYSWPWKSVLGSITIADGLFGSSLGLVELNIAFHGLSAICIKYQVMLVTLGC